MKKNWERFEENRRVCIVSDMSHIPVDYTGFSPTSPEDKHKIVQTGDTCRCKY